MTEDVILAIPTQNAPEKNRVHQMVFVINYILYFEYINGKKLDEVECVIADLPGIARGKAVPATKFSV